jgi:hypothetical protein
MPQNGEQSKMQSYNEWSLFGRKSQ